MSEPASQRAEESVIGSLMRSDDVRHEVFASGLEGTHFYYRPYRVLFNATQERYYADDPIDPLSISEAVGPRIAEEWKLTEREAVDRVIALAKPDLTDTTTATEHAKVIKRHSDYRELLVLVGNTFATITDESQDPEAIAGALSAAAMRIVSGSMTKHEVFDYAQLGRRWVKAKNEEIAARAAGQELGAWFGIKGMDSYLKGLRPTELAILGGDPGIGKSALSGVMARNFAVRQMRKPPERRIGTLYLSLEMGEEQSSDRFAQFASGVDGERLRLGTLTKTELREIAQQWADERELPLYANFSGELRETQVRAIIVDSIRRHNVGVVFIDHMRFLRTDEHFRDRNDADEQIVRFLKSTLAKELNLAVICLAHTTKGPQEKRRPTMDDLRGSKMISAFADFVMFPYSPWRHARQEDRDRGLVEREAYELIFDKARGGATGTADLFMDFSRMAIR